MVRGWASSSERARVAQTVGASKKQQAQMLADLQTGAEVLTTGGIIGTIVSITGDLVILRVKPDNIKLQLSRASVASLVKQESAIEEKK